jgi:Phosphotransferase enzyme family
MQQDHVAIAERFAIEGRLTAFDLYGTGHINRTYLAVFETPSGQRRFIFQNINHTIFTRPLELMENVRRVTEHLHAKVLARGGDPARQALTLIPTHAGAHSLQTDDGDTWRAYTFIEDARSWDVVQNPRQIREAMRAFGQFQLDLADLPAPALHETIPNFHNTPQRFRKFLEALDADTQKRASGVRPEIDFALAREADTRSLTDLTDAGALPVRITHNDTKLNNVMLDNTTGQGVCVIDLDTTMPGLCAYDFGDAVRIGACTAGEDETDLSKVALDMAAFDQLTRGYIETARSLLTSTEVETLAFGPRLMTLECGMRFLTDYLQGDVYFRIHRPEHNLDRARTQFKMVADMETHADEMDALVRTVAAG